MHSNEPIDINFEEVKKDNSDKQIHGKPLYFSTSQVAQMVNETDSTIRFWCTKFNGFLHVETIGTRRRFTEHDIEEIKHIKKLLREKGFTINQVAEYCGEEKTSVIQEKVKENNPLAIQALASAVTLEISNQLEDFKFQVMEHLTNEIQQNFNKQNEVHQEINNELQENMSGVIDEIVSKKLTQSLEEFKSHIDTKEQEVTKRDNEIIEFLRKNMDDRKKETELQLQQQKKGFFSKLFRK